MHALVRAMKFLSNKHAVHIHVDIYMYILQAGSMQEYRY